MQGRTPIAPPYKGITKISERESSFRYNYSIVSTLAYWHHLNHEPAPTLHAYLDLNSARVRQLVSLAAVSAGLLLSPVRLIAQAGAATDIIVGRVTDSATSAAIENASITATSLATGLERTATTSADGRFVVVFPDGGGHYALRIRRLGYNPAMLSLQRRTEADRISADVRLSSAATVLSDVTVTAARHDSVAAGGTGRTLLQDRITELPLDAAGDLAAIAALAPGVIATPGTDTTAAAFSVGGQRTTQNHVSLDGLTFAAGQVPRDAIRETKVVTSTYDVSKGQFSGGEVASATRSGTNSMQGSLSYDLQPQTLQAQAAPSPAFSRIYQLNRFSASLGGPLIKNRFFAFGAIEGSQKENPIATLLRSDPITDARLGIATDTVDRFLSLVSAAGLPLFPAGVPQEQTLNRGSALGRLDFVINEANHLTVRADWNGTSNEGTRGNPRGLLQSLGTGGSHGGGLLAGLTTQFGMLTNDVRLTAQTDYRRASGYVALPRGRVLISSATPDGAVSTLEVGVGGNQDFPSTNRSLLFEGGDEAAWLSPSGKHRIKAGFLVNHANAHSDVSEEKNGVYFFNSLADFAANTPALYTRVLDASLRKSSRSAGAFYVGDAWQPAPGLEFDYGGRIEGSRFGDAPAPNPAVEATFGIRTDRFPSEMRVSPRFGFTYAASGDKEDEGALTLRGGFGEFRGTIPDFLFGLAAQSTGLLTGQRRLTCTGADVPAPDWRAFESDVNNIPSACAGSTNGSSAGLPSVYVFGPKTGAPRVWRTSLGVTRGLFGPIIAAVDLFYIRGFSQLGAPDLNLNTTPQFLLANEANRPVYVPASTIDPATGTVSQDNSRLHAGFGTVSELQSFLRSRATQATIALSGEMGGGKSLDASYTYSNVRDQALGFEGESADDITGGNPNQPIWGRADDERRHQFEATMTMPLSKGFRVAFIGRLVSGFPFTPGVGNDINGDGVRNDKAFIFNPNATADTSIANGMRRLLETGPATARQCLPAQFGKLAERNGCTGPWVPGFDLKLSMTPDGALFGGRLTLSASALNTLVGIDELLHGRDHLRGWGQDASSDRRLLFVTGFDPVSNEFKYRVNQHFGAASGALNPFRIPFILGVQGRLTLGQLKRR
jgi:Carboxypeptidase regulatory-like domain